MSPPNSPLGTGSTRSVGNFADEKRLEFHLLHFALQLLRALLGFLFQNFDLPLHAGDGFFALRNLQLQFFFRIVLCLSNERRRATPEHEFRR